MPHRRRPSDDASEIARLRRLGGAALPNVDTLVDDHMARISAELDRIHAARDAGETSSARRMAPRRRRGLVTVAVAMASFAIPALAVAGELPDPAQRVAARIGDIVHVKIPTPQAHDRTPAARDARVTSRPDDRRSERDALPPTPSPRSAPAAPAAPRASQQGIESSRGAANASTPGAPDRTHSGAGIANAGARPAPAAAGERPPRRPPPLTPAPPATPGAPATAAPARPGGPSAPARPATSPQPADSRPGATPPPTAPGRPTKPNRLDTADSSGASEHRPAAGPSGRHTTDS